MPPKVAPYATRSQAAAILRLASGKTEMEILQGDTRLDEVVNRAELLQMLTRAFELEPETGTYRDVPGDAWYAPLAGLAKRYTLFPLEKDELSLHPTTFVTFRETILAAQALLSPRTAEQSTMQYFTRIEHIGALAVIVASADGTTVAIAEPEEQAALPLPSDAAPDREHLRTRIMERVNSVRTHSGLHPLTLETRLAQSAQRYAEDMARGGFFSHVSPSGQTFKDRMIESGYYDRSFSQECGCFRGFALAENLARGQKTADQAFAGWMASPKHRAAILHTSYQETGIGVVPESLIWVQHFGGSVLPGQEQIVAVQ